MIGYGFDSALMPCANMAKHVRTIAVSGHRKVREA